MRTNPTFCSHLTCLAWAAAAHQRLPADAVLHNAASGPALETLRLPAAYCVSYREALASGDAASGAYLCPLVLSDPHWLDLTGQRAGRGLAWHRRRKAPAKSHQAAGWRGAGPPVLLGRARTGAENLPGPNEPGCVCLNHLMRVGAPKQ